MHIRGNQMNLNAINPYSAAADQAAAAQKAAEVRRKLMKDSGALGGNADPEEVMLLGKWMGSAQSPGQEDGEYRATAAGKDSDFG